MHSINPHLATQKSDGINSGAALLYVSETFSFLTNRSLPFPFLNGTKRYFTLKNPGSTHILQFKAATGLTPT